MQLQKITFKQIQFKKDTFKQISFQLLVSNSPQTAMICILSVIITIYTAYDLKKGTNIIYSK